MRGRFFFGVKMTEIKLGQEGQDKITGFKGIIIGKCDYLFGCNQYGLAPQVYDKKALKRGYTEWFDEGRIKVIGKGILPKSVMAKAPGADINRDRPKGR